MTPFWSQSQGLQGERDCVALDIAEERFCVWPGQYVFAAEVAAGGFDGSAGIGSAGAPWYTAPLA